ncbi:MAG: ABC transporter ATP-binding protein [Elusimicrobia bacterium]|nr:ABC transporter ATP-binding protein [Elusimicrobiota bacterium]
MAAILEDVSKTFALGGSSIRALKKINLKVERGEFLALVGPSGSGKTTLLNILGCIERPSSGRVVINGAEATVRSSDEMAELRGRHLGYVFQAFNLLPALSAVENVEFPLRRLPLSLREKRSKALTALREVGLEALAAHKPSQMSGGQRQRVAVARALAAAPVLVLADEPTANLDQATGIEIVALMKGINRRLGTTFIFSTHDPKIVAQADRVVKLADGEIW